MNSFLTVMGFSMRNKLRTKSFLITTLIIAILVSIVINLPYIISQFSSDEPERIGFAAGEAQEVTVQLKQYFDAQENADLELVAYPGALDEEAMKDRIEAGDIKGYLVFEQDAEGIFPSVTYKSEALLGSSNTSVLAAALQSIKIDMVLSASNLSAEQRAELGQQVVIDSVQISSNEGAGSIGDGKTEEERALAMGMVYVLIIVLFMGTMITGQLIATEITAEKSSRVMEILVTSVAPLKQMFGKIVGMLLVGLMQIGLLVAVAVINITLPHNIEMLDSLNIDLSKLDPVLIVYAVVFYLLGYFLYATLFAAIGSIVSRTEDLGQAVMPLTFLSLAGFYIGIFGMTTPDAPFVEVASFIPFFSPFIMFLRIGLTDPAVWEVALSFGILIASIFFFGWISAKIYRTGVLMYGKRPTFKELRKAMKAYKI